MFKELDVNLNIDLIHVDGRLEVEDCILLKEKINDNTFFIMDDFEGNEKGVANLFHLLNNNVISRAKYCVIYPIDNLVGKTYGLIEKSTTAVLLPIKFLKITSQ